MKLRFKYQKFQADAVKAVIDVFAGQPYLTSNYRMDIGNNYQISMEDNKEEIGWKNHEIVPELSDRIILENLNKVQRKNQIELSTKLEGKYNLTIEMETGVGKTYTYIKTMFELNKHYGWSKFIVVVPSIAIREGVYKSFEITQEHFAEEYGKKIRFFIYNSAQLNEINDFASQNSINVMIINYQAFNSKDKDKRKIYTQIDTFGKHRPIDVILKTNPIIIIDEPQSVESEQTKQLLKEFNPFITLRYSATHKSDSIYNMVYRLDAVEAYNKKLVKKISVKGITETGSTATESYIYLESINLSKDAPTANIQFDYKGAKGIRKVNRVVGIGYNLYHNSGQLEEYKNGFIIKFIDGRDNSIELLNGIKLCAGDVIGKIDENQLRRIQIRETILTHIQREKELFYKGIKVLSLFFIDEVAKYKQYNDANQPLNGIYADMFEEEYTDIINNYKFNSNDKDYINYLSSIKASATHAGYFSIDKKGRMVNCKTKRKETITDDIDAYDLIMKNKELLLDIDPQKSPVRFIFSHSALREGWDNPNVFQICTLKQSSKEIRKRQEVGRGLRLCVNQNGERMDTNALKTDVHDINILTVIASESYDSFAKSLQSEIAEDVADRPRTVTTDLFIGKVIKSDNGNEQVIDTDKSQAIYYDMVVNGYVDCKGILTDKYYSDKNNSKIKVAEEVADYKTSIIEILDNVYDSHSIQFENERSNNIILKVDENKLKMPEFQALWNKINTKSIYSVDFDTKEIIKKSILALNSNLRVSKIYFKVEAGTMEKIESKEELIQGLSFNKDKANSYGATINANSNVKYDLVGKIVDETMLTRKAVIEILKGIDENVFNQFKINPEEFIIKTSSIINNEKAIIIIENIKYNVINDHYDISMFTESTIKGKLGVNAMKTKKHIYDHIIYDSINEQKFANELEADNNVAVYIKLPHGFYISTPVGHYNPDWAIAFYNDNIKHIYFVAETKGSMNSLQLRTIEDAKIKCAKKHFEAISNGDVIYDVVNSYEALLDKVIK